MSTSKERAQVLTQRFQIIQQNMQEVVASRQKLESQSHENQSVKAEFDALDDDSAIYKLIGPVLIKQDQLEAKQNVSRRIDLLADETQKVEQEIKKLQAEAEQVKTEIISIQQDAQEQEASAATRAP